ncbi:MAG: acyltransferase family protein [Deltaproteobacteria bacterium]|nr:acyltransferase family protein [Deltaproteobacteria bacterium]
MTTPLKTLLHQTVRDHPQLLELLEHVARAWHSFAAPNALDDDVDEFGRDLGFMERVRPLFDFMYDTYWRVQARGVHHIPAKGRALIVANHSGTLAYDGAMIHMAVFKHHRQHRMTRFLVEDLIQYLPFIGTFFNRVGGVRACPENAERLLKHDELLTVFPEGVKGISKLYKDRYRLSRFGRGGVVRLAIRTRTPIIPCAVVGAEEIHPILWKTHLFAKLFGLPFLPITPTFPWLGPMGLIPLPSQWVMIFGKPIRYDRLPQQLLQDPLRIHTLTEELRQTIQQMVGEGLTQRRALVAAAGDARASTVSRVQRQAGRTR